MNLIRDILPENAETLRPREALAYVPWCKEAGFTIDGRPFDPETAPHLREIAADMARVLVIRKGSQVQVSSFALGRVLHGADQLGQRWIYFLPTDDETDDFVADRVEKTVRDSDYLSARIGHTDNRGLKHLGPGLIYFRGLFTKRRAKSVPADGLVFDEVDEHKPENIAFGEDRVLASEHQNKIFLSVPSFTRYGIDLYFADSDQRFYQHRCEHCGEWNCLDEEWPNNFIPVPTAHKRLFPDGATHYCGCRWCGAELDIRNGEWVATYQDRLVHGYHVSRLYSPFFPPDFPNAASYIMHEWERAQGNQERLKRFHIAFRGYPFDGEGARLNDELLNGLEAGYGFLYRGSGLVMGVDQGNALHVSVYAVAPGQRLQLVYCERALAWSRVAELFRRFGCYAAGCDRGPGIHEARGFAHQFKGRVFLISYGNDEIEQVGKDRVKRRVKEDLHEGKYPVPWITVDRTNTLDSTVDFVESGNLALPDRKKLTGDDLRHYEQYRLQVIDLKWKYEDTPSGRRRVYLKNENHFGMSLNYARLAAFEAGVKPPPPRVLPKWIEMSTVGNA